MKGWNREARALHNTEDDATPAPSVAVKGTTVNERNAPKPTKDEVERRYEQRPGPDPGH